MFNHLFLNYMYILWLLSIASQIVFFFIMSDMKSIFYFNYKKSMLCEKLNDIEVPTKSSYAIIAKKLVYTPSFLYSLKVLKHVFVFTIQSTGC
jgi:hypothetical protein